MTTDIKIIEDFVKNSNWIEGIYDESGVEWFDHLDTAMYIEKEANETKKILHPLHIHAMLMKNILKYPGLYRHVQVYLTNTNDRHQPIKTELVEKNMQIWFESLKNDLISMHKLKEEKQLKNEDVEKVAWHYHHWFESTHPFIDGNGRTGRLILNNIRRSFDLDWLIIKGTPWYDVILIKEHKDYYDSIKKWRRKNNNLLLV